MKFLKKIAFIVIGIGLISWVFFLWQSTLKSPSEGMVFEQAKLPVLEEERSIEIEPSRIAESIPVKPAAMPTIWPSVPFTSQAPTGEWGRSEFQDGCEEASVLMVAAWRTKKTYTKDEVKRELIAMARHQEKQIDHGVDTDVKDTAEILLRGYFDITEYAIVFDFTLEDLKQATADGLAIVPTNGQALKNPNFTRPGPLQHMLVVTGYDAETHTFITNDPGTRKGEGYRYGEEVLFAAIREYPTGKHLPIMGERKAMIVIPPSSTP